MSELVNVLDAFFRRVSTLGPARGESAPIWTDHDVERLKVAVADIEAGSALPVDIARRVFAAEQLAKRQQTEIEALRFALGSHKHTAAAGADAEALPTSADLIERRMRYFVPGATYRHYKGQTYTAMLIAHEHESRVPMCVYVAHDTQSISVRPADEFFEDIEVFQPGPDFGKVIARFIRIAPEER